jgi:LuxR family transcriptional regulator, maltose regulon positive regulatory protein
MSPEAKGLAPTSGPEQAPGSASILERPRLVELVDAGLERPLTLISAPAGSGKTVMLRAWMAGADAPETIAHVSLGHEHAARRTFWLDVLAAAARAHPGLAGLAVPLRGEGSLGPIKSALEELPAPLRLVLDDFHEVGSGEPAADLEWLLEHTDALRLALATRSDPPLRLQRLRVAGRLAEIRAAELAFTPSEAGEFLAPLELSEGEVGSLWARCEGWVAGLRLAELSLEGHPDPSAFITGFAGGDRAVTDYLMSEVIGGYTEETLLMLLRTSIVDRLNGELAAALAGPTAGEHSLREFARSDGFVEALDSSGTWFRYHTLFADVLRGELRHRLPDELPELHAAASRWYVGHGEPLEAVRHAVAASDWRLAADIIGDQWLVCLVHGRGPALHELASGIPADVVNGDAELALGLAGLLLEAGELAEADELLLRAYELADKLPSERRRRFSVTSTATALYRARLDGDVGEALSAARLVLEGRWDRSVAAEVRALTLANLGIAEFWADETDEALEHLQAAAGLALEFGTDFVLFTAEAYLAAIDARQGRLSDAHSRARTAIQLAERRGWSQIAHIAIAYSALATVHIWWSELEEAERAADLAHEALGRSREPLLAPVVAQVRARIHAFRGDSVTAMEVLRGGGVTETLPPWLRVSAAMIESDLWMELGEPARARGSLLAVESAELSDTAVGIARLELVLGEPDAALRAVADFVADEREALMPVSQTEAWTIAAIARDTIHDEPGALRALERALDLAEPRGYSQPILRHGAPVRSLVRRLIVKGTAHRAFAGELLTALENRTATGDSSGAPLLEPLSEREVAVLRFLPTMMSNAEIASEMFVSVNTVKTHLKHIYRKLDVSERRDAVRRGRDLRLLSPGLGDFGS